MTVRQPLSLVCLACAALFPAAALAQTAPSPPPPPPLRPPSVAAPRPLAPEEGEARLRAFLVGSRGLTSAQAAKRAAATSREAAARRAGAEAAKAREDQATAGFWPRLALTARYTRLSPLDPMFLPGGGVSTGNPTDFTREQPRPLGAGEPLFVGPRFEIPIFEDQGFVGATLSVPVSDYLLRFSRALAAARKTTLAAQKEEEGTLRKVASDARIAYYDWIRARGAALVLEQRVSATEAQVRDAGRLFEAGFVSRADVLRAESGLQAVRLALVRARDGAALTEERLRVLMHDEGTAPYQIGEDLLAPAPPVPGIEDRPGLLREAVAKRPELVVLGETEAALADLERLYRVGRYPRLDLVGNASYSNPNQRIFPPRQKWDPSWDASVVLSWTPTDIPGASANEREQRARARQIAAQREALLDGLRLEVTQAATAVHEATAAIETSRLGLRAAEEGYRVRRDLYGAGKGTIVEVLDAEADLTRARLEVVNALVEARIARVRLDFAVGRDVIGH